MLSTLPLIALFFAALAVLFLILAARRRPQTLQPHPARRAHLRIGLIFAAVSVFLFFEAHRL